MGTEHGVEIDLDTVALDGDLVVPEGAQGVVLFAHGSGSSRRSPRNQAVAETMQRERFATLLMDLLTADEERIDARTGSLRFNIGLLAERLVGAIDWLGRQPATSALPLSLFGASTGAAAALVAAAQRPETVRAVVSRGGRPDLAGDALARVRAPTILIVGGRDVPVIGLNEQAAEELGGESVIRIVEGASHLFEEPGALEEVAQLAAGWCRHHLSETR